MPAERHHRILSEPGYKQPIGPHEQAIGVQTKNTCTCKLDISRNSGAISNTNNTIAVPSKELISGPERVDCSIRRKHIWNNDWHIPINVLAEKCFLVKLRAPVNIASGRIHLVYRMVNMFAPKKQRPPKPHAHSTRIRHCLSETGHHDLTDRSEASAWISCVPQPPDVSAITLSVIPSLFWYRP